MALAMLSSRSAVAVRPSAALPQGRRAARASVVVRAEKNGMSLKEAMAFSGPAPETINGRLAMLGFAGALGAELSSGESVAAQFSGVDQPWILYFAALFAVASLVPLTKQGIDENAKFGPFTAAAEKLNGRAAMIGLAALLAIENSNGAALF